ncbi:hypothetical protein HRM2_08350 [Desulforapulum autotrophicum HRM2]|uniref:Uncharacterized protein n=2 Tax=Desulforapulum autotrophicum TaxID=2296 RepID=C0QJU5_DESAH|nr:hypothetical protein HRM2_08350 [Desulforapulum autotrophicum HRM2]
MKTLGYILFFSLFFWGTVNTACLAEEDKKQVKNTAEYVSQLNHEKMKKLMNSVGKPMPDAFYNCLCRKDGGGAASGVSVSYHPAPLEPVDKRYSCNSNGPPCMARGMGCWRFPLPSDQRIWEYCLENYKLEGDVSVVDTLTLAADNLPPLSAADMPFETGPTVQQTPALPRLTPSEEKLWHKLTNYRNNCLPSVSQKIEDIVVWSTKGTSIVQEALKIADQSDSLCEEAIAVSLFLKGQDGLYPSELAVELIKPWIPSDPILNLVKPWGEIDVMDAILPPHLNNLRNLKSNIEVLDKAYSTNRSNQEFRDASKLFIESRSWSKDNQELYVRTLEKELNQTDQEIVDIRNTLGKEIKAIYPTEREVQVFGPMFLPNTKVPNDAVVWQRFSENRDQILRKAEINLGSLLRKRAGLEMKKGVIKKYRGPLREKGCDAFMQEMKGDCDK